MIDTTVDTLEKINAILTAAGINHRYKRFNGEISEWPYWTSTYKENSPTDETTLQRDTLYLNGYTVNTLLELEEQKAKIKRALCCYRDPAVRIKYRDGITTSDDSAELKSMELTFDVYEWGEQYA